MRDILDCGHEPTKTTHSALPGYATDPATGKRYCYACATARERADMVRTGRATLYLHVPHNAVNDAYHYSRTCGLRDYPVNAEVTNWPGLLRIPVRRVRQGRHNIAGVRYDVWFTFEGQTWHGVTYGDDTEVCHCRRTKERT